LWQPTKYYNWYVNINDPKREHPTAGSINVVNQALGIFRVKYPVDQTRNIKQIIPGALEFGTVGGVVLGPIYTQLTDMRLSETHTMETMISVIWLTDKEDGFDSRGSTYSEAYHTLDMDLPNPILNNKYTTIELDYTELGGKGPDIEYLSALDYSRHRFPSIKGSNQIDEVDPANIGNLEDMAQAEGAKIINQYRDRISGTATYAGAITGQLKVIGTILGVDYFFTPGRGLETKITLAEHTPTPSLLQNLSQGAINFIQGQVTKAGEQNDIGASK